MNPVDSMSPDFSESPVPIRSVMVLEGSITSIGRHGCPEHFLE